ncbi:MAG: SDR family oxidoreductase [Oscillospiraceae bacterium]|jgi:3-oxoacyl-[acyl-carrier protein] reductase|nr:SDR family oxidoreductase [Oscillospiraceae bacterium]
MSRSLVEYGIDGRVAVVTGAGKGIGREASRQLAKMGAKVALIGRGIASVSEVENEIREFSSDVIAIECDVGDEDSVNKAVMKVIDTFGQIDILVNNAGIEAVREKGQMGGDILMTTPVEQYHRVLDTNLIGHYNFMRACIPYMSERKYGRIVNVSSVTAFGGGVGSAAYVASKAGSIVQTKAFARKFGRDNITINCVAPGMVDTPMHDTTPKEMFQFAASGSALGRIAHPIDIVRIILFLAQENLYMTGETLVSDGGGSMTR